MYRVSHSELTKVIRGMDHQRSNFSLIFGILFVRSEALEGSLGYYFENWLMKLKCPNLRSSKPRLKPRLKQNITCKFLSVRLKLLLSVHYDTVSDRALIFSSWLLSQLQGWPGCQNPKKNFTNKSVESLR